MFEDYRINQNIRMMGHHYSTADNHPISKSNIINHLKLRQNEGLSELRFRNNPIKEDYYITKDKLGVGLNGTVVICIDKQTNKKYALKVCSTKIWIFESSELYPLNSISKTLLDSAQARREIMLHYKACQNCPYIVKLINLYENTCGNHAVLFVVMER
jgi:serine/threonine protein kinase